MAAPVVLDIDCINCGAWVALDTLGNCPECGANNVSAGHSEAVEAEEFRVSASKPSPMQ